jgi:hypothetical protein
MARYVASHQADQIVRRPPPPSSRARYAEMSRAGFLALVAGWSGAVVVIFAVSAFVRCVG